MYNLDIEFDEKDPDKLFDLAVHHLRIATGIFDMFSPEEFAAARGRAEIPVVVSSLVNQVAAEMELEGWLVAQQRSTAAELAALSNDERDPGLEAIWERHEAALRSRLEAAGYTDEQIQFELGETAAMAAEARRGE